MKSALIILFGLLLCNPIFAQSPEKIIAIARYQLVHQYDTINPSLINTEVFDLFLGENSSVFKSYDKYLQDSTMKAEAKKTGAMAPPLGRRASNEETFLYNKEKKVFVTVPSIAGKYVVERSYPNVNWSILAETKKINDYRCQKALGDFHGRKYHVWFTNDLPFKAGPWKLTGLPGLIIEAKDSTGRIKFELINFKTINNPINFTHWNEESSIILWTDYKKIAKAIEDDPVGYIEKRFGGKLTFDTGTKPNHINPMLPKKSINFPLEAIEYYIQK